uniref:Transcription factor E2F8 n=1 Tax=Callorhinchus milii TaxID=7868 RepID=A0A4W3JNC4_CALMI|eukprot:gi/632941491/ref/XP_007885894.1/ PREDICTED: transcription factor E2F8 [Callorhinchus milii]
MSSFCLKPNHPNERLDLNPNGDPGGDFPEVDRKENIFLEPHMKLIKTPLEQPSSSSHSVLGGVRPDIGTMTTPTKLQEVPIGEPWTPTANLKMLISAASPEIRNREKKKELFNHDENIPETNENFQDHLSGEEFEKLHPSRKEKSLGLLCYRFLARYPNYPNPAVNNDICLDEVAGKLNVERRRIYDIVNVLESLHMVSRLAKNRYTWHGRHNLAHTLGTLKNVGENQKYAEQMRQFKKKEFENGFEIDIENHVKQPLRTQNAVRNCEVKHKEMCFVELPGVEFRAASVNGRKDKSLRVMSQKFVMLFLVSNPRVVNLDIAAKILIGEDQKVDLDHNKFKTKIRRLYDIANVLTSLELIKKVHVAEERGRKPAFKWIGPEVFPDINDVKSIASTTSATVRSPSPKISREFAKNLFPTSSTKQGFTRHASLNYLLQNVENDQRKISSAPTSPTGKSYSNFAKPELYPSKMAQLAAICKLQLEAQSKTSECEPKSPSPQSSSSETKSKLDKACGPVEPTLHSRVNSTIFSQAKSMVHPVGVFPVMQGHYSSILPVMLPQNHSGSYTIYFQPTQPGSLTAHPSGFTVQSITFAADQPIERPGDLKPKNHTSRQTENDVNLSQMDNQEPVQEQNGQANKDRTTPKKCLKRSSFWEPTDLAYPKILKSEKDISPSQQIMDANTIRGPSPNEAELLEIHQARLKSRRGLIINRPSPRALHLDPEFVNTPEDKNLNCETLEHSVECFLENEDKCGIVLSEAKGAKATTLKAVPVAIAFPTHLSSASEPALPSGYLIPLPQQAAFNSSSTRFPEKEKDCICSTLPQLHCSPISGVVPVTTSDSCPVSFSPTHVTPLQLHCPIAVPTSVASLPVISQTNGPSFTSGHHFAGPSPSPGILNFTLQNLGLINPAVHFSLTPGPVMAGASREQASPIHLQHGKMVLVKPVSPHHQLPGKPVTFISIQQSSFPVSPEGAQSINRESFFRTPGGPLSVSTQSSLTTVVSNMSGKIPQGTAHFPQRKLEVCTEDP